ncbi:DUF1570 domain-containing protein [uncultured Brevundimonas sp.]|uniref:DUF1570 domain-containing protein n=1 Tax=uncultured Brevundimonas sp. TaxID=213418 RepID=UPI0025F59D8C|nr:DUF1570 domain-containing protein [uncultured Brevundimonas sp.]
MFGLQRFHHGLAAFLVLMTSLIGVGSARAEWLRAETDHFVVYGDTSESSLRRYAGRIERFDALLRAYYPIKTEYEIPKLEIFMANGRRDMNSIAPGIDESIAGYYSPNSGRIYTVVNTRSPMGDVVAYHEYAHHFMFQMRSGAYPSWFIEGFAEYYSTTEISGRQIKFGRHNPGRMNSLTSGANTWAKMEDVLEWRTGSDGRYPAHQYYAQAWAMTHYFMSTPERTQMLGRYLAAVANGEDSVVAMQAATGRTAAQLQADVWRYISGSISVLTPQIEIVAPTVSISRLTKAEADAIWLDVRLDNEPVIQNTGEDDEDDDHKKDDAQQARDKREEIENRAELIRSSLALASEHGNDRVGALLTARAQRLMGRPDLALAALTPLINDELADADILRVAAMALLDQVRTEQDPDASQALRRRASAYLARAMDADPLDFRIYLGLNDTRRGQAQYPTPNDLSTLEVAYALAPQSFDTRLRLGEAYLARGMNAAAINVLTPVSNSPHGSGYKRQARTMINQARAAEGQAAVNFQEEPKADEDSTTTSGDPGAGEG